MAITKQQKINLGIFVSLASAILLSSIFLLIGVKMWEKKEHYFINFQSKNVSMSGLSVGSAVKYSGIQIGRVSSIKIDPQDVSVIVVHLEVDGGTPIAEDSVATLGNVGITGLKYIELSRGSFGARIREPGEEIPSGPSFVDEITGKAAVIAQKTELILNQISKFLDDERQTEFWNTVKGVQQLVSRADKTLEVTQPELQKMTQNVADITKELHGVASELNVLLDRNTPALNRIVSTTDLMMQEIQVTRAKLNSLIDEATKVVVSANSSLGDEGLRNTLGKVDSFIESSTLMLKQSEEDIILTMEHLREASENLNDFSTLIRENPSLLLRTPEAEERDFK